MASFPISNATMFLFVRAIGSAYGAGGEPRGVRPRVVSDVLNGIAIDGMSLISWYSYGLFYG